MVVVLDKETKGEALFRSVADNITGLEKMLEVGLKTREIKAIKRSNSAKTSRGDEPRQGHHDLHRPLYMRNWGKTNERIP